MLNASVCDGKVEISAIGNMSDLCSDISTIIMSVAQHLSDETRREMFKSVFATGFVSGHVYGISREEMDNIMIDAYRLADEAEKEQCGRGKHEAQ